MMGRKKMPVRCQYRILDEATKERLVREPQFAKQLIDRGEVAPSTIRSIFIHASKVRAKNDESIQPSSLGELVQKMIRSMAPFLHEKRQITLAKTVHAIAHCRSIQPSKIARARAALYRTKSTKDTVDAKNELTKAKNAKNQLEELFRNEDIFTEDRFINWFRFNVKDLKEIAVSIDWTEFHADGHNCFVACLMFADKQSVPVLWKTVERSSYACNNKNRISKRLRVKALLKKMRAATDKPIVVVGDREFGCVPYILLYQELNIRYCCRTDNDIGIANEDGESKKSPEWLAQGIKEYKEEVATPAVPAANRVTRSQAVPVANRVTRSQAVPAANRVTRSQAVPVANRVTRSQAVPVANRVTRSQAVPAANRVTRSQAVPEANRVTPSQTQSQRVAEDRRPLLSRTMVIHNATVTDEHAHPVPTVVVFKQEGMKDIWTVVTDLSAATARTLLNLYANRWTIETGFKHAKDLGTGLGWIDIHMRGKGACERRDRMWLMIAMASKLWVVVGKASELLGLNRLVETCTETARSEGKKREFCLHRLGREICEYMRDLPKENSVQVSLWKMCDKVWGQFAAYYDRSKKAGRLFPT
jgi:hypothetical protein